MRQKGKTFHQLKAGTLQLEMYLVRLPHQGSLDEKEPLVVKDWEFLALLQGYVSLVLQGTDWLVDEQGGLVWLHRDELEVVWLFLE